jgi:hypothetical protein
VLDDEPEQSEPDPIDERRPVRVPASGRVHGPVAKAPAPETADTSGNDGVSIAAIWAKLKGVGKPKDSKPADSKHETSTSPGAELAALFGEELLACIQGREPIKLDPTVDRLTFRKQAEQLGKLDYTFKPMEQTFHPSDSIA